jgi:small-conductance mechanosensitive channel
MPSSIRHFLAIFTLLTAFFVPPALAADTAQLLPSVASSTQVDPSDPAAVREMISRLSDQEVRALLIERLDVVAKKKAATENTTTFWVFLSNTMQGIAELFRHGIHNTPRGIQQLSDMAEIIVERLGGMNGFHYVFYLLVSAMSGVVALRFFDVLTERLQCALDRRNVVANLPTKCLLLSIRLLLALLSMLVFVLITYAVADALLPSSAHDITRLLLDRLVSFALFGYCLLRVPLSPNHPQRRLLNLDDWHASFILRHLTVIVFIVGLTGLWFSLQHNILQTSARSGFGFWLNLVIVGYFIALAWRAKSGISGILQHADDTPRERYVASIYPLYIIGVVVFTWFLTGALIANNFGHLLTGGKHYLFLALLIWAPAMDAGIRSVVSHIRPPMQGEGLIAERAYHSSGRSYIRIGRLLLVALVLNSVIEIWDIDIINLASAGLGSQFVVHLVESLWIVLGGYLLWELVTLWINRKLAAEQTASGIDPSNQEIGGEGGGSGGSRLSTVLPLLRWAAQTLIVTSTVLLALGALGIDTTPLLAGAGVVGLAIGFGAQKLVSDVVSGIFFLIDDAFREGEYVEVEGTVGSVEKISLRSMQLRHHRGPVHTIPYGEIPKVTNFSRDWVIMKLRFTVPFETDLHQVKKIFKKIGQDLLEIPEYEQDLLQTFKSQGAIEVDDVGIVVRGKFMAKPGTQFTLRKEIYQRVQRAFEENGLQFARKEVRVKVDGPASAELSENDKQAIAAAAAESADQSLNI